MIFKSLPRGGERRPGANFFDADSVLHADDTVLPFLAPLHFFSRCQRLPALASCDCRSYHYIPGVPHTASTSTGGNGRKTGKTARDWRVAARCLIKKVISRCQQSAVNRANSQRRLHKLGHRHLHAQAHTHTLTHSTFSAPFSPFFRLDGRIASGDSLIEPDAVSLTALRSLVSSSLQPKSRAWAGIQENLLTRADRYPTMTTI